MCVRNTQILWMFYGLYLILVLAYAYDVQSETERISEAYGERAIAHPKNF